MAPNKKIVYRSHAGAWERDMVIGISSVCIPTQERGNEIDFTWSNT